MTKGIRAYTADRFERLLPKAKELGSTGFRRKVMEDVIQQFDISVASAATAYNFVLKNMREKDAKKVEGIGRAEGVGPGVVLDPKHDARVKGNEHLRPNDPDREGNRAGGRKGGAVKAEGKGKVKDPDTDARLKANRDGNGDKPEAENKPRRGRPPLTLVTVIKERTGEEVARVPRNYAKDLIAASGVRGRPKLVIKD
jgi:hypothetical protein